MAEPAYSIVGILNLQSPLVVFFREKREVQACGGCYLKQEIWKGVHQLRSPAFLPAIPFTIYIINSVFVPPIMMWNWRTALVSRACNNVGGTKLVLCGPVMQWRSLICDFKKMRGASFSYSNEQCQNHCSSSAKIAKPGGHGPFGP